MNWNESRPKLNGERVSRINNSNSKAEIKERISSKSDSLTLLPNAQSIRVTMRDSHYDHCHQSSLANEGRAELAAAAAQLCLQASFVRSSGSIISL